MPATNPNGSDLNARSAARRATNFAGSKIECPKDSPKGELQDVIRNGRKPEVTPASSVFGQERHWIMKYIHVFHPGGPAVGCSNLLLADLVQLKTCWDDA